MTGPGDSTDDFLTEDEDERPRGPRETGPEDSGALGVGRERVLKRRKVVLSPRVPARQPFPVAVGFSFFRKNQIAFFFLQLKFQASSVQDRCWRGCLLVCAFTEGAAWSRLRAPALRQGGLGAAQEP